MNKLLLILTFSSLFFSCASTVTKQELMQSKCFEQWEEFKEKQEIAQKNQNVFYRCHNA